MVRVNFKPEIEEQLKKLRDELTPDKKHITLPKFVEAMVEIVLKEIAKNKKEGEFEI